jgi:hypothetical protein
MSELEMIADKLWERAEAYREPFGDSPEFAHSPSFPIVMALQEVSMVLRAVVSDSEQFTNDDD